MHTFETAQKIYLNSCKKLVNISKDGLIEESQVYYKMKYLNRPLLTKEGNTNKI